MHHVLTFSQLFPVALSHHHRFHFFNVCSSLFEIIFILQPWHGKLPLNRDFLNLLICHFVTLCIAFEYIKNQRIGDAGSDLDHTDLSGNRNCVYINMDQPTISMESEKQSILYLFVKQNPFKIL